MLGLLLLAVPYAARFVAERRLSVPSLGFWTILVLGAVIVPLNIGLLTLWRDPDFNALVWPELVRLLWGLAACLAVINWCNPALRLPRSLQGLHHMQTILDRRVLLASLGYLLLGLVVVAVGLLAMRHTAKIPLLGAGADYLPRLSPAEFGFGARMGFNPNRVAGAAILFLPLTFALLLSPFPGLRAPLWWLLKTGLLATTLFFGLALLITQSRAGLLAAAAALGLVLLLSGRRGWVPLTLAVLVALAALEVYGPSRLVDAVYVPARHAEQNQPPPAASLLDRIRSDRNVAGRLMIWERAGHALQAQPLTGVGLGLFDRVAQEPFPAQANWRPDADIHHAHNLFLQTALDLGIPGLMALALLVLLAGVGVLRLYLNTLPHSPARFWSVGMLGVWLAFLIYSLLEATTVGARPAITYWIMLGLCIGLGEQVTLFQTLARHYLAQQTS